MDNEFNILQDLYNDLYCNIEYLKMTKNRITKIKNDINSLTNNFFEVNCNNNLFIQYLNIERYNEVVINLETLMSQIDTYIKNNCQHEWINDTIDIDLDRSQNICYCIKCEISKK